MYLQYLTTFLLFVHLDNSVFVYLTTFLLFVHLDNSVSADLTNFFPSVLCTCSEPHKQDVGALQGEL